MKKLFLILAIIGLVSYSHADEDSNSIYVKDFVYSTQLVSNLRQSVTGANYSCGPTSLLYVRNYYMVKNWGVSDPKLVDAQSSLREIQKIYNNIPKTSYNNVTTTGQLKNVVKKHWRWSTSKKASGGNSIQTNLGYMKSWLKKNQPLILALEPNYAGNPIPGYAHIVVFYKYDKTSNRLYYFDPYYGGSYHSVKATNESISKVVQGNLPYLRIAP